MAGLPEVQVPGWSGCLGLEPTPELYVQHIVEVFREVRRVLRDDGTLWLNLGDSYASQPQADNFADPKAPRRVPGGRCRTTSLKSKDLCGIPWRCAFALQADGWYLRSDIIWHKCLSGGAHVYAKTQKGEMPMTVKDMVRLDPSTVKLWDGSKWNQAVAWKPQPRGDDLEIELRNGERISCTAYHRWPTSRGLLEAHELAIGDVIASVQLPEPERPRRPAKLNDTEIGWFVGMYLAEGSQSDGTIQIASHVLEQKRIEELTQIAEAYDGYCFSAQTSENGMTININSPVLLGVINAYVSGSDAKTKHLNVRCWKRSNLFLAGVLEGWLAGDGHMVDPGRYRLGFALNDALASDLRTLCARCGFSLRIRKRKATCQTGEFSCWRGDLYYYPQRRKTPDTQIIAIHRSRGRRFWMISLAEEPHLFALASGTLTGNSNPMPESVTDRPTKAHEYLFLLAKSARYYYDAEAIKEPVTETSLERAKYSLNSKNSGFARDARTGSSFEKTREGMTMGEAGFVNPAGRNKRSVWTIVTASYKVTVKPDYVGSDGKSYTASPDCPIHGHLAHSRSLGMAGCDERRDRLTPHNPDSGGNPELEHGSSPDAMTCHSSLDEHGNNALPQMPESTDACRNEVAHHESTLGEKTPGRTSHIPEEHDGLGYRTDSPPSAHSSTASGRSTQTSRTDHVRPTSRHDIACAQTSFHTQSTSLSGEHTDLVDRMPANSNGASDSCDNPPQEIPCRNAHIETLLGSSVALSTSRNDYTCTCRVCQVSHFATFPPALVEPCILAGTSQYGCCPKCGKLWTRVIEKGLTAHDGDTETIYPKGTTANRLALLRQAARERGEEYVNTTITTGWRPGCECGLDAVPGVVLDPFVGSGTVMEVALKLGRHAVGIELSETYCSDHIVPRLEKYLC